MFCIYHNDEKLDVLDLTFSQPVSWHALFAPHQRTLPSRTSSPARWVVPLGSCTGTAYESLQMVAWLKKPEAEH